MDQNKLTTNYLTFFRIANIPDNIRDTLGVGKYIQYRGHNLTVLIDGKNDDDTPSIVPVFKVADPGKADIASFNGSIYKMDAKFYDLFDALCNDLNLTYMDNGTSNNTNGRDILLIGTPFDKEHSVSLLNKFVFGFVTNEVLLQFIKALREDGGSGFEFICNNGYKFSKSDLLDIIKELLYSIHRVGERDGNEKEILDHAADELAEKYPHD